MHGPPLHPAREGQGAYGDDLPFGQANFLVPSGTAVRENEANYSCAMPFRPAERAAPAGSFAAASLNFIASSASNCSKLILRLLRFRCWAIPASPLSCLNFRRPLSTKSVRFLTHKDCFLAKTARTGKSGNFLEPMGSGEIMSCVLKKTLHSLHGPGTRQVAGALLSQNT